MSLRKLFRAIADENLTATDISIVVDAIKNLNVAEVLENKSEHVDINAKNKVGRTLLSYAVGNGYTDIVSALLEKGADPKHVLEDDTRSLLTAITQRKLKMVREILQATDWEKIDRNLLSYPLLYAANTGQVDMVNALLEETRWSEQDKEMLLRPLRQAALKNFTETMSVLLSKADWNNPRDQAWLTHLLISTLQKEHIESAKLLLGAGADPNTMDRETGLTPLDEAIANRQTQKIMALLEAKANIDLLKPAFKSMFFNSLAKKLKPFPATFYSEKMLENLWAVLLEERGFLKSTIDSMAGSSTLSYIGAYFINQLAGIETHFPKNFYNCLAQQLFLENEKNYFRAHGFANETDIGVCEYIEVLLEESFRELFAPKSIKNPEGYLKNYYFIGKALAKSHLAHLDSIEHIHNSRDGISYCVAVFEALNKYAINLPEKIKHDHANEERDEVKIEKPEFKITRLANFIKAGQITPENKAEIFYELATAYREFANTQENDELKLNCYHNALQAIHTAMKSNNNAALKAFAIELKNEYLKIEEKLGRPSRLGKFSRTSSNETLPTVSSSNPRPSRGPR